MRLMKISMAVLAASALLGVATTSKADLIVLSGILDAAQVVLPVRDSNGNVIGSTATNPDGTPVSASTATGFATVTIDTVLHTITTDFSWDGLSGPADRAHLHDAPAGVSRLLDPPNNRFFREVISDVNRTIACPWDGGFYDTCVPTTGSLIDVLQLDDTWFDPSGAGSFTDFNALLAAFEADGLFLDIHTQLYPGDEIRGQLLFNRVSEPATILLLCVGLLGLLAPPQARQRVVRA